MSDKRDERLREILEEHKRRLQRSLRTRLDGVRAHTHDGKVVEALDAADASALDLEQHVDFALAEMVTEALHHVDRTLARLERGDHGFCVDCNERIPEKRLTALPFASRCRDCEELRETGERAQRVSARTADRFGEL